MNPDPGIQTASFCLDLPFWNDIQVTLAIQCLDIQYFSFTIDPNLGQNFIIQCKIHLYNA